MKNSEYDKRVFYSESKVAATYDNFRYEGQSGAYVNNRELATTISLLPSDGTILDVPTGTGRLLKRLNRNNFHRVGGDYSEAMLNQIGEKGISKTRLDAFNTPFENEMFDVVVSLRFLFHYSDINIFFKEVYRILKPGGVFICQTYRWSPLAWDIPVPLMVGGKIHIHSDNKMQKLFYKTGLKVIEQKSIFLFSPFFYKYLPFIIVKALDIFERIVPDKLKVDAYWKSVKAN